jgi:hypothetical protein
MYSSGQQPMLMLMQWLKIFMFNIQPLHEHGLLGGRIHVFSGERYKQINRATLLRKQIALIRFY